MLILEGADLVGKTTLQKRLLELPAFTARGYLPDHMGVLPDGFDPVWGYVDRASRRVVMDRFHLSQVMYDLHWRRQARVVDPDAYRFIDGKLAALGAFTVVLTCDSGLLQQRHERRGDGLLTFLEILKVNDAYARMGHKDTPEIGTTFHCTPNYPEPELGGI